MNAANDGGANDWRLWSALNSDGSAPCSGSSCPNSELGHLYFTEGSDRTGAGITTSADLSWDELLAWRGQIATHLRDALALELNPRTQAGRGIRPVRNAFRNLPACANGRHQADH